MPADEIVTPGGRCSACGPSLLAGRVSEGQPAAQRGALDVLACEECGEFWLGTTEGPPED